MTRLELATSSLARRCSTTELHPHFEREGIMSTGPCDARLLSVVARPLWRPRRVTWIQGVVTETERRRRNRPLYRPEQIARPLQNRVLVEH